MAALQPGCSSIRGPSRRPPARISSSTHRRPDTDATRSTYWALVRRGRDAGGQRRLDRRRQRPDGDPAAAGHQQLLDEEGVAVGPALDPVDELGGRVRAVDRRDEAGVASRSESLRGRSAGTTRSGRPRRATAAQRVAAVDSVVGPVRSGTARPGRRRGSGTRNASSRRVAGSDQWRSSMTSSSGRSRAICWNTPEQRLEQVRLRGGLGDRAGRRDRRRGRADAAGRRHRPGRRGREARQRGDPHVPAASRDSRRPAPADGVPQQGPRSGRTAGRPRRPPRHRRRAARRSSRSAGEARRRPSTKRVLPTPASPEDQDVAGATSAATRSRTDAASSSSVDRPTKTGLTLLPAIAGSYGPRSPGSGRRCSPEAVAADAGARRRTAARDRRAATRRRQDLGAGRWIPAAPAASPRRPRRAVRRRKGPKRAPAVREAMLTPSGPRWMIGGGAHQVVDALVGEEGGVERTHG